MFVDTVAPSADGDGVRRSSRRRAAHAALTYRDLRPPGCPRRDASGVARLTIRWGDGTVTRVKPGTHRIAHVYRRAGPLHDHGHGRSTAPATGRPSVRRVKIAKPPKPKPKPGAK